MSCRRAYELDLPGFLDTPRDAAWDDFRAHYPRCRDCASEVAAWTSLHQALADRHPEPAELLRWSDDPDSLDTGARARVAQHVERCAACRDELRALAGFALPEVAPGAPPATERVAPALLDGPAAPPHHPTAARTGGRHAEGRSGSRPATAPGAARAGAGGRRDGSVVRRVVWHPAFAYALLAVVILLPTFRDRFDLASDGSADLAVSQTRTAAERDAPTSADRRDAAGALAELREERFGEVDTNTGGGSGSAAGAGAIADEQAAPGADDALVDRTAPRLLRQAPVRPAPAVPAEPLAAKPAPAARAAGGRVAAQAESAGALRALGSVDGSTSVRLVPGPGGGERTVVIALPPHLAGARVLEVRIRDDAGGRELRQQMERPTGATSELTVALPAGFVAPRLVVELYADGVGPFASGVVTP